jgi:hypothetical protein
MSYQVQWPNIETDGVVNDGNHFNFLHGSWQRMLRGCSKAYQKALHPSIENRVSIPQRKT